MQDGADVLACQMGPDGHTVTAKNLHNSGYDNQLDDTNDAVCWHVHTHTHTHTHTHVCS